MADSDEAKRMIHARDAEREGDILMRYDWKAWESRDRGPHVSHLPRRHASVASQDDWALGT